MPSRSTVTRFSGRGRSSVESQKSIAWRATRSRVHSGASFVSPGFSSDYDADGQETDEASLISWAANRVGVAFPDTFAQQQLVSAGDIYPVFRELFQRRLVT